MVKNAAIATTIGRAALSGMYIRMGVVEDDSRNRWNRAWGFMTEELFTVMLPRTLSGDDLRIEMN